MSSTVLSHRTFLFGLLGSLHWNSSFLKVRVSVTSFLVDFEITNGRRFTEPSAFWINCPATSPSTPLGVINSLMILSTFSVGVMFGSQKIVLSLLALASLLTMVWPGSLTTYLWS